MTYTILIDVDDTLGNMKERLQNIYRNKLENPEINFLEWNDYTCNRYGVSDTDLTNYFIEDRSIELISPHEYISEATHKFKELGWKVVIVTARGWYPDAYNITKEWLERHNVYHDEIIIVGLYESKVQATLHIDNVLAFIDDRLDYCREFITSRGIPFSLVYAQPWNVLSDMDTKTPGLYRVNNFYEILEIINPLKV